MPRDVWLMIFGVILGVIAADLCGWLPKLSEWIVRQVAARLPKRQKIREQEWLAILDRIPSAWSRLFYSCTCIYTLVVEQEKPAAFALKKIANLLLLFVKIGSVVYNNIILISILTDNVLKLAGMLPIAALLFSMNFVGIENILNQLTLRKLFLPKWVFLSVIVINIAVSTWNLFLHSGIVSVVLSIFCYLISIAFFVDYVLKNTRDYDTI